MPAFDHRRAQSSLIGHAMRFRNALRKQDHAALAELVLPQPPDWMLDPKIARRAWVKRPSIQTYLLPRRYGQCLIKSDVEVGRPAPWGKRDYVLAEVFCVSLDHGQTWRFIDGIPDLGRMMAEPAFAWLAQYASEQYIVLEISMTIGGEHYRYPDHHAEMLAQLRRALPGAAARARAMAFIKTFVRRYSGKVRVAKRALGVKRALASQRAPVLRALDLRDAHLVQLRRFRVGWDAAEAGAPVLEPPRGAPEPSARERAELLAAFEILLAFGKLPPRAYACDGKRVAITKAHAKLFPRLSVSWEDGDGPCVDPKRPYDSRSYYEYDVAEALGVAPAGPPDDDGPTLTRGQEKELRAIHKSMRGAVRALLLHGAVPRGRFRKTRRGWQRG